MQTVCEYFLTEDNYITGWIFWPGYMKPEFIGVQKPTEEMMTMKKDKKTRIYTGTHVFKLVNKKIEKEAYKEATAETEIGKLKKRIEYLETMIK